MMKQRKIKNRKRETFGKLFSRALILCLVLTTVFCLAVMEFVRIYVNYEIKNRINELSYQQMALLNSNDAVDNKSYTISQICLTTTFTTGFMENWFPVMTTDDENGRALSVITDKDDNIVFSNRNMMISNILFSDNDEGKESWYICDWQKINDSQMKEIYETYKRENLGNYVSKSYAVVLINRAVVNRETKTFVPKELTVRVNSMNNSDCLDEKHYTINCDDFDGEEIEFNHDTNVYPRIYAPWFAGENDEEIIAFNKFHYPKLKGEHIQGYYSDEFYYNNEPHTLKIWLSINLWNIRAIRFVIIVTLCFFGIVMFISLLYCWRRNVINKAQYAFEDYQKSLTNNLAHDLKTPLMAIGGYAENMLETCKNERDKKYLNTILCNISFADNLISRTLQLNRTSEISQIKNEKFSIVPVIENIIEKYSIILDENDNEIIINGDLTLETDRDLFTAAIENIISNAVLYTKKNGRIDISVKDNTLTVSNDVAEKVDTKNLLMPYVKGDKARTNRTGSGLGLSIANESLKRCGAVLKISCVEFKFVAKIKF